MDPEAIALFRALADSPPSEREEYYVRRQVPAPVRNEVESLLRFAGDTAHSVGGFVTSSAENVPGLTLRSSSSSSAGSQQPVAIGRYEVVRLLGRGGMGEVYLARDPVLDRDVAVKLIGSELDDSAARSRLVLEARAAGRLRHANIVTIYDAGEHEGRSYIAMEYVHGETLGSLIRRQADLPLRRRLELIEGACAGLAHAHRAGVVHLDIKPDNLMLDETGVVKVVDFGIARVLQGEALATRNLAGTLRYMSPEQVEGRPLDRRSDIFSLGCSLFELVAYVPAYIGSTRDVVTRIAFGPLPSLLASVPGIDPRLDAIVRRAMALDASDRYADLEDLSVAIGQLRAEIDPDEPARQVSPISTITEHAPSSLWRSRLLLSLGAAAALTTGAGALWIFGATAPSESTGTVDGPVINPAPTELSRPSEATAAVPTAGNEEVWRRLALGDREGVLQLLRAPAADGVAPDKRLASGVVEAVRASVLRSRQTARAASGAAASEPFRSAEERLARGTRMSADGRPIEALGALWQAADLYAQSIASGQRESPRAQSEPPAPTSPAPAITSAPVAPSAERSAVEFPRPEVVTPPAAETNVGRAASPVPDPTKAPSDADAILDALRRYHAAYEALDVSGVLHVYPSLGRDRVEQLRRTFAGMSAYEVQVRDTRVDVRSDVASVHAVVVRRMVPRVGSGKPVANEVETEFRLRRDGSQWVITDVKASD